ncbi:MAG: sigma-70 family RNA polymerase sigma factor [Caulobacteraceae bacterium]|nr:sigma-70 family RNA polymerase sigma factor [Caulobacteraceae bacterium]
MDADLSRQALTLNLHRVAGGDRSALQAVYDATSAKLFGVVLRILNDRSEAEDVLQEVYINVWTRAGSFDETRASPITWLAVMARNRAIDRQRQVGRRTTRPIDEAGEIADDAEDGLDTVLRAETSTRLDGCLNELEDQQRSAIRTAFFEGRTYEDVAKMFSVPTGTMKSWIRRSLIRLKACLGG